MLLKDNTPATRAAVTAAVCEVITAAGFNAMARQFASTNSPRVRRQIVAVVRRDMATRGLPQQACRFAELATTIID